MNTVVGTAAERVELSRERLRLAMRPVPSASKSTIASDSWWQRWLSLPLFRDVAESVSGWWSHHPLRPLANVAGEASGAVARPLAQRHPVLLVLAAGVAGAALAWSRPWRWIFRSALFAGLAPQLASRVAASLPLDAWMTMLGDAMARPRASSPVAPDNSTAGVDPLST